MTQNPPTFLTSVQGFTPVIDALAQAAGHTTAAVYGVVWRYCQMDEGVCRASVAQIGRRLGLHPKTARRHLKRLCQLGYLEDTTPARNNGPHIYRDIGAQKIIALTNARPTSPPPPKSPHPGGTERPPKREPEERDEKEKGGAAVAASARHPAIRAFRHNAHRYPAKSWFQDVADTVGEHPADIEFWGQVVKAWVGTGYNPVNVRGMLDCYRRRQIPSTGAPNVAGPRRRGPPTRLQGTIETGIRILKQEGKWPT